MNVIALQSGSNGNCIYVESDGVRLLFDAGISGKQAQARLAAHGRNIEDRVAFVVDDGARRLGILTDLGHAFDGLVATMRTLDAVVIESNYDLEMLKNGAYPESLKRRIGGRHGHLSNADSAGLVRAAGSRLKWACLARLSADNNNPELAAATHRQQLGNRMPLFVATRYEATDVLEV